MKKLVFPTLFLVLMILFAGLATAQPDLGEYPYYGHTLLAPGEVMQRGVRYSMNGHFLTLNPDGNLVVAREDGGYVWGFDTIGVDFLRVARVEMQTDGNLAAYDADGGYIWSALTEDPDPSTRLILTPEGALQLYSDARSLLWSSDVSTSRVSGPTQQPSAPGSATGRAPDGAPFSPGVCHAVTGIDARYPSEAELVADPDPVRGFIESLNCIRGARNLPPMRLDPALSQACQYLAEVSAANDKLGHDAVAVGGSAHAHMKEFWDRTAHYDYQGVARSEAAGQLWLDTDISLLGGTAILQWTDSSTHYRPFLSLEGQEHEEVGFGYARSNTDPGYYYTCAVFGDPR